MSVIVRPYRPSDASSIAALYRRHPDNPNPVAGGVTAAEFTAELADRRTAAFFVATQDEEVVGTFGLFGTNGRRAGRVGELIADMFFVAPAQRNGVLTGRLFTEAVTWMFEAHHEVLRLTVNPANTAAFRLYRRVGCVAIGYASPSEDGNVELYNYIPLILRGVIADLGTEALAALGQLSSFGCLTTARQDDLKSDTVFVDGTPHVAYALTLAAFRLEALIDVERAAVREATLTSPDGSRRPLDIVRQRPPEVRPEPATTARHACGDLEVELDGRDGTLRVSHPGHFGPILTSTWPSCHPSRSAGWREAHACDLEIVPVPDGLRVTERHAGRETACTITVVDGWLMQEFRLGEPSRVFQTVGLRQAELEVHDAGPGTITRHPVGLGLGVRASDEIAAAGWLAPARDLLVWRAADRSVALGVPGGDGVRLINAGLLDRPLVPAADGTATLRTDLDVTAQQRSGAQQRTVAAPRRAVPDATAARATPGRATDPDQQVRIEAGAGGLVGWTHQGTKVLRSPYPRRRSFACNPYWSAGLWVTTESTRHTRESGLGWGVPRLRAWHPHGRHGFASLDHELIVATSTGDSRAPGALVVDVRAPHTDQEVVVWLTPQTAENARVVFPEPDGSVGQLQADWTWQRWTAATATLLTDGRWLTCRPARTTPRHSEIVVRSTRSGLLIGCVTHTSHLDEPGTTNSWIFEVADQAGLGLPAPSALASDVPRAHAWPLAG